MRMNTFSLKLSLGLNLIFILFFITFLGYNTKSFVNEIDQNQRQIDDFEKLSNSKEAQNENRIQQKKENEEYLNLNIGDQDQDPKEIVQNPNENAEIDQNPDGNLGIVQDPIENENVDFVEPRVYEDEKILLQNNNENEENAIPEKLNVDGGNVDSEIENEIPIVEAKEPEVFEEVKEDVVKDQGEIEPDYHFEGKPRKKRFNCVSSPQRRYYGQRGKFWVLYNYLLAERSYECDETITYSTIADFTFIDNLFPILERWDGPVSLAVYTPGSDFNKTLEALIYLRECVEPAIKERVSVHFFFENRYPPSKIPRVPIQPDVNYCDILKEPEFNSNIVTFRQAHNLKFPVNLGRNIARELATTHYIFPSDIELYPSPGLIPKFFDMIVRNESYLSREYPRVFVIPVFEISDQVTRLPENKKELLELIKNETVVTFHKNICQYCHKIPKYEEWIQKPGDDNTLSVFQIARRTFRFKHWEPFYIGTHTEPFFDERLTWEGRRNKMTQGYIMCILNYDYMVFDNAFLIHRPGIKIRAQEENRFNTPAVRKQNTLIDRVIVPELKKLYGIRKGCVV